MNKRKAFTLMEIVIAMFLLTVVLLSVFMLNKSANQSSMDAYYELLAFSLAREPIEVFRGFGYKAVFEICRDNSKSPALYKVGETVPIKFDPSIGLQYPADAEIFEREISLKEDGTEKAVKIKVVVSVKGQSRAEVWMRKKSVVLESIIMEQPRW